MTEETKYAAEEDGGQVESDTAAEWKSANEELMGRISQLEETLVSRGSELAVLRESLTGAVLKYRTAIVSAAPDVPGELVQGETLEEIDVSLQAAQDLVARVRQQIESAGQTAEVVPAGAPPRRPPDLSTLSPAAKITHALTLQA